MKHKSLLFITIVLLVAGCGDDVTDRLYPGEVLVGRWQEVACGNDRHPELKPDGHIMEFTSNGYRITGSIKHYTIVFGKFVYDEDGEPSERYGYRYSFFGNNLLRLDYAEGPLPAGDLAPTFHIYKRLK
jgi:hypothetical protein